MIHVEIVESNPGWGQKFCAEKDRLQTALGDVVRQIEHIGSTSVPGLGAKPVIDIQVGVESLEQFLAEDGIRKMEQAGYVYLPQFEELVPFRRLFTCEADGVRLCNIHLLAYDHPWAARHLYFRDYLRETPTACARYEAVKRGLAEREWKQMPDYAQAKNDIVAVLEEEAYAHFNLDADKRQWLRESRV